MGGFNGKNIDGIDPCKELLDIAEEKNRMGTLRNMGSNDSHSCFADNQYDVIYSSGVFFVSPSHAGFEVFPELIRMTKKGGYIVISTGDYYLQYDYVNFKLAEDLEKKGLIKIFPKRLVKNYRKPIDATEGNGCIMGAILTYQVLGTSLEEMEQGFNDEAQQHMKAAREGCTDLNKEYKQQQELYGKYAKAYDTAMVKEEFNGPKIAADEVARIFPNQKDIKMLDYGCGSGTAAYILMDKYGFNGRNIDGIDPCKELLDIAEEKNRMGTLRNMGSNDSHSCFADNQYDVIYSSGVFFVSPSHAGFEIFPELLRMTKKGGYIVISTD